MINISYVKRYQQDECPNLQSNLPQIPCYVDRVRLTIGHVAMVNIYGVRFYKSTKTVPDLERAYTQADTFYVNKVFTDK